ncbi:MAG TPA: hypothetical protein VMD91_06935 [Candidatus Sulfotelmatobacter sp.]|nr:hypothetical protein [Candidatus Sulfotelmatobacter sp.]
MWLATTRAELHWLLSRVHVVREVRGHLSAGLDTWMDEGLTFIDAHDGHSVIVVTGGR